MAQIILILNVNVKKLIHTINLKQNIYHILKINKMKK